MYPIRFLFLFVSMSLVLTGCTDEASNPFEPDRSPDPVEALAFTVPEYGSSSAVGPALSGPNEGPDDDDVDQPEDSDRPPPRIIKPRTITGFWSGQAWAEGANEYVGNVGRIRTTAEVTFEGRFLAEQPVLIQDHIPFIFDFGRVKFITAFAPVSTDHTCGLTVHGSSEHAASWQFFTGAGAPAWGEAIFTTVAQHSSQAACPEVDPGPIGVAGPGPGGSTCYFRVTYDLDTGQVISMELLYCTPSTGEGL